MYLQGGGLNIGSSFWDLCLSLLVGTFEEAVSSKLHHFVEKVLEIPFERYFEAQCSYYSFYNRYTNWLAPEVSLRVPIGRRISGDWAAFSDRAFYPNDHWSSLWSQNCGIPYFKSWKIGFRVVQSSEVSREGSR